MTSPCCPSNSHPSLSDDYIPIGNKSSFQNVEFYQVGSIQNGGNAIVIFSDIWGWDSGRVRRFADILSEIVDYVVIPKLLSPTIDGGTDDDGLPPGYDLSVHPEVWAWLSQFNYGYVKPKIDDLFTYLNNSGVEKIGLVGVCYGGYLVCHSAIEHSNVVCGVIPHPSIHAEEGLFGGNNAELAKKVHIPLLLLPAGNDPASYLPGGDIIDNLVANNSASRSVQFPDMVHGFSTRGDLKDEKVARDVDEFIRLMTEYFKEHLLGHCGRRAV